MNLAEKHMKQGLNDLEHYMASCSDLVQQVKQLQEEAIFRETLLDMVRSKNKKLEQKIKELEEDLEGWRNGIYAKLML